MELKAAIEFSLVKLVRHGQAVDVPTWQAMDVKDTPFERTWELLNLTFEARIPAFKGTLQNIGVGESVPWAEDHFRERVCGEPLNPGVQYQHWPWFKAKGGDAVTEHLTQEKFSHTYMERYWPAYAGEDQRGYGRNIGVRYNYGDLDDVVKQLAKDPTTRQAYLPVWFPEDTGAVHGERVPCTLGYHFLLREGALHCWYDIRSCDAVRHFRNDVYLTCRLVQWMIDRVQVEASCMPGQPTMDAWHNVMPGTLHFCAHSFHAFDGDMKKLRKDWS